MRRRFRTLLLCALLSACGSSPEPAGFDFDADPRARQIGIATKTVETPAGVVADRVFVDGLGREAYFRGFNVSGSVKHVSTGFLPFRNEADARFGLDLLARNAGANLVRYTLSWEGVQPRPGADGIDEAYLQKLVAQIRHAARNRVYVFLDYHWDIYTRHLMAPDSTYAGNGAPAWVTPAALYGTANCFDELPPLPDLAVLLDGFGLPIVELETLLGIDLQALLAVVAPDTAGRVKLPFALPLCFSWSQYLISSQSIRKAYEDFWLNAVVPTEIGEVRVQDEFIRQLGAMAGYLRAHLSAEEFAYVLGIEPFNEPYFGDGHAAQAERFDNDYLWPFYRKVKAVMAAQGWGDKPVFAEPEVTWDTNAGITPATGGGYLQGERPGAAFVFAPHFYDAGRFGVNLTAIDNGAYLPNLDRIRAETRFLDTPVLLGEFGAPLFRSAGSGVTQLDTVRSIKAVYQALELSDASQSEKTRYADFYTPPISATQWQWDIYYDQHAEPRNGTNPDDILSDDDAWNGEDFSVIGIGRNLAAAPPPPVDASVDTLVQYKLTPLLVERAYPRRVQGEIMSFHYNDAAPDQSGERVDWVELRPEAGGEAWFAQDKWLLAVWRGRKSEAPTEIYLPRHMAAEHLAVVSERRIVSDGLRVRNAAQGTADEILLADDPDRAAGAGHRLLVWDTPDAGESTDSVHYVFVLDTGGARVDAARLASLQAQLSARLGEQHLSPFYFAGKMSEAYAYPPP